MRIKISRKEAKESAYWLRLLVETSPPPFYEEGWRLRDEAVELKKILSGILVKSA
jgi:four helix bundle protein